MGNFLLVILMTILAEGLCTWYIQNINANNPIKASFLCALNLLVSKVITIGTVKDNYLLIAVFIGGFIGVYITMRFFPNKN